MTFADVWLDGWGILLWIAWVAFWVLLIAGIVALVRGQTDRSPGAPGSSAMHLLEHRYARGEISRDEFLERRETLLTPSRPAAEPAPPEPAPAESDTDAAEAPTTVSEDDQQG